MRNIQKIKIKIHLIFEVTTLFSLFGLNLMLAFLCRFEVLDEDPGDDEENTGQRLAFFVYYFWIHVLIYLVL